MSFFNNRWVQVGIVGASAAAGLGVRWATGARDGGVEQAPGDGRLSEVAPAAGDAAAPIRPGQVPGVLGEHLEFVEELHGRISVGSLEKWRPL